VGNQAWESEAMADGYGSPGTSLPRHRMAGCMQLRTRFLPGLHPGTRDRQPERSHAL